MYITAILLHPFVSREPFSEWNYFTSSSRTPIDCRQDITLWYCGVFRIVRIKFMAAILSVLFFPTTLPLHKSPVKRSDKRPVQKICQRFRYRQNLSTQPTVHCCVQYFSFASLKPSTNCLCAWPCIPSFCTHRPLQRSSICKSGWL